MANNQIVTTNNTANALSITTAGAAAAGNITLGNISLGGANSFLTVTSTNGTVTGGGLINQDHRFHDRRRG